MAAARVAAAALQYSKWMSRFICYGWLAYRFAALIAGIIRPEAAEAFASTLINLDWIMLVNEGTYLINSLGEKYIFSDRFVLSAFNKGWFSCLIANRNDSIRIGYVHLICSIAFCPKVKVYDYAGSTARCNADIRHGECYPAITMCDYQETSHAKGYDFLFHRL